MPLHIETHHTEQEANANVDKDTQTLLFSLATSRKSALIKELQQWEEFEKKLESL